MVCEDGNDDSDDAGHRDADTKPEGNHEDTEVQDHWVFEAEGLSEIQPMKPPRTIPDNSIRSSAQEFLLLILFPHFVSVFLLRHFIFFCVLVKYTIFWG